ncbi:MAG: YjbQ family protein, partial [Phycisphaeraceae bacterium]
MAEITRQVREAVREAGVETGRVVVYVPHTTAGVTINENADPDVK